MAVAAMQAGASKASHPGLRRPPAELGVGWLHAGPGRDQTCTHRFSAPTLLRLDVARLTGDTSCR